MGTIEFIFIIIVLVLNRYFFDFLLGYNTQKIDELCSEENLFRTKNLALAKVKRKKIGHFLVPSFIVLIFSLLLISKGHWTSFSIIIEIKICFIAIAGFISWKFISQDKDLVLGLAFNNYRLLILVAFGICFYSPIASLIIIITGIYFFFGWEHHNHMTVRILLCTSLVFLIAIVFNLLGYNSLKLNLIIITLWTSIYAMHYWIPFAKKILISARANKFWAFKNELHLILPAAYFYGWFRFTSEHKMFKIASYLKTFNIPLQILTLIIEGGVLIMIISRPLAIFVVAGIILMHLMIWLFSGILFLENVIFSICLLFLYNSLPEGLIQDVFSINNFVLVFLVSFVMPLTHLRTWRPNGLGWWEARLSGRVFWQAKGISGKIYTLNNLFFSPYDRSFGRLYGRKYVDKEFIFGHLGEVNSYILKKNIDETKGHKELVNKLYSNRRLKNDKLSLNKDIYICQLFDKLNKGERKEVIPGNFSFIKPIGGQLYFESNQDKYNFQEMIKSITCNYKEVYITDDHFLELENREILSFNIQQNE